LDDRPDDRIVKASLAQERRNRDLERAARVVRRHRQAPEAQGAEHNEAMSYKANGPTFHNGILQIDVCVLLRQPADENLPAAISRWALATVFSGTGR